LLYLFTGTTARQRVVDPVTTYSNQYDASFEAHDGRTVVRREKYGKTSVRFAE